MTKPPSSLSPGAKAYVVKILGHQRVSKVDEDVDVGGEGIHDRGDPQTGKVRQSVGGLIADVELHVRLWPDHCHVHRAEALKEENILPLCASRAVYGVNPHICHLMCCISPF